MRAKFLTVLQSIKFIKTGAITEGYLASYLKPTKCRIEDESQSFLIVPASTIVNRVLTKRKTWTETGPSKIVVAPVYINFIGFNVYLIIFATDVDVMTLCDLISALFEHQAKLNIPKKSETSSIRSESYI